MFLFDFEKPLYVFSIENALFKITKSKIQLKEICKAAGKFSTGCRSIHTKNYLLVSNPFINVMDLSFLSNDAILFFENL